VHAPDLSTLRGSLEIGGAVLILLPSTAHLGGLLLAGVMAGAVVTHLVVIGGNPVPAIALLAITAAIAVVRWPAPRVR
jgi:putative oxidoreductase